MKEATGGAARIGIIASSLDVLNQKERIEGFMDEISDKSGMEVLEIAECNSERLLIIQEVRRMIEEWPDMNALLLTEGYASEITGDILTQMPGRAISVVSFDGVFHYINEYLQSGIYYSNIRGSVRDMAYEAVDVLTAYLDGEVPQDTIYTGTVDMRKDNVENNEVTAVLEDYPWHMY